MAIDLKQLSAWTKTLGVLPVPLFQNGNNSAVYVLLNGASGSFCLDLEGNFREEGRSNAWSANVGHYVALTNEHVEVQSWHQRPGVIERYSRNSISSKIEAFHDYLAQTTPNPSLSVVAHGIRIFRSLRNALGAETTGVNALQAFLCLLACAKDQKALRDLQIDRWRLSPDALAVASSIDSRMFETLLLDFGAGRPVDKLRLDVDLLLRHASGLLFQEAHFEAQSFSAQQTLPFFSPGPISLAKKSVGTGVHFTPPPLARCLVEQCITALGPRLPDRLSIFDPACGSGEFLHEAMRQLRLMGFSGALTIRGWDISPAACAVARFALAADVLETARDAEIDIRNQDSLDPDIKWPADTDTIVMNPPFVSWQGMTAAQHKKIKNILGDRVHKRPDLSGAFVFRAAEIISKHGVLGTILPASFFDTSSNQLLRRHLQEILKPVLIARLGSHMLFPGAIVDAGFYVAQPKATSDSAPIALWSDYRLSSTSAALRSLRKLRLLAHDEFDPVVTDGYSIYNNPELANTSENWAPRPYRPWQLLKQLSDRHPTAAKLFNIRQGARTGLKKVFVIAKQDLQALPASERKYFRPAVLNESFDGGRLVDSAFVFYPYGENVIETEAVLRKRVPNYYEAFLLPNVGILKKRARIAEENWWGLMEHRSWQVRKDSKLVSAYFGDRGSFAWDETGEYAVVQGYAWLPKPGLSKEKFTRKLFLSYLALLNSQIFAQLLAGTANHVGGGQWDLSTRFVSNIPVPDLTAGTLDPSVVVKLSEIGSMIHEQGLKEAINHYDQDFIETLNGLFGVDYLA